MPADRRSRSRLALVGQEVDVRFYARRVTPPGPVLVLGAANGRIAGPLCAAGSEVTAVDPSPLMIEAAEERRAQETPEAAARLHLLCADLRSLRLSQRFPQVFAPQNALALMGSLEELDALLATIRHHLADGGELVFDLFNPVGERGLPPPRDEGPHQPEPLRPVFTPHLRERRRARVPEGEAADSGIRRLRLRPFYPDEVDGALARAGLEAREKYGRFDGKPFDRTDPVQIVVAGLP